MTLTTQSSIHIGHLTYGQGDVAEKHQGLFRVFCPHQNLKFLSEKHMSQQLE